MRVWIVNQHAYTPELSAGIRHFAFGRELIGRGHQVLLISTSFYHKAHVETRLFGRERFRHEDVHGVPFLWVRTPPYRGNSPARLWNMLIYTWRVWSRQGLRDSAPPDVIIGSSPHLFGAFAAERLARRYGVPFLFETRDLWPSRLVESGSLSAAHPLVRVMAWLERYLYRRADHVLSAVPIAPTAMHRLEAHIAARGGRPRRMTWLPNGVDLSQPVEPAEPGRVMTFMYAGAHSAYAALDHLLDAAGVLRDRGWQDRVRIVLYGDGPEKERLVRRARAEGLEHVRFEDSVPKTLIWGRFQQADAFLMTYRESESTPWAMSPSKLFEYMAAGRPVIYAAGRTDSPVEHAAAGLSIEPSDPIALADAMIALAETDPAGRAEMGKRGRAYVQRHHDFVALGERLEQVLTSVVKGEPPIAERVLP